MPKIKKKTYKQIPLRLETQVYNDIDYLANQDNLSKNLFIENACKFYIDYLNQQNSPLLNETIIDLVRSMMNTTENRINNKSNQLLSSLAIELGTLQMIIANSLNVSEEQVKRYRDISVSFLKTNNRVFKMKEVLDE